MAKYTPPSEGRKLSLLVSVTLLLLLISSGILAQTIAYKKLEDKIDSLGDLGLPRSALVEINRLDSLAHLHKNAVQQIKATVYRMTFLSYLEETKLTAVIATLKKDVDRANYPAKPVLQSLLAEMYWRYYKNNTYKFLQRSTLEKPSEDFREWDLKTLITRISGLYQQSLRPANIEMNTPVAVLDGALISELPSRKFRPTVYDLLAHRALEFWLADEPSLVKPKDAFYLTDQRYFSSAKEFAASTFSHPDTLSTYYLGLKLLQNITQFHLQKENAEAVADLELRRLAFLYSKSKIVNKDSLYEQALKRTVTNFRSSEISADALFLLGQYHERKGELIKAVELLEQAAATFPVSVGGLNAKRLLQKIRSIEISVQIEDTNLPAKPILALLKYRNVNELKVRVYKLPTSQFEPLGRGNYNVHLTPDEQMHKIEQQELVKDFALQVPAIGDYKLHTVEFGIPGLATGAYAIIIHSRDTTGVSPHVGYFQVSKIAFLQRALPNQQQEIVVMNRSSGETLKHVNVVIRSSDPKVGTPIYGTTDDHGSFKFNNRTAYYNANMMLFAASDTLIRTFYESYGYYRDADDTRMKAVVFTDRQIYRPGQTIYFKGLLLKVQKDRSTIVPDFSGETIELLDNNSKKLAEMKVKTNEFGTFSGSFVLPAAMLNGRIRLEYDGERCLNLQVEEYKRPTFKVSFLPVKEVWRMGDTVVVRGTVRSFAGYGLSAAKLAYRIERRRTDLNNWYLNGQGNYMVKADSINIDPSGEFALKFVAVNNDPAVRALFYTYQINVDVLAANGETQSNKININVGSNPVKLRVITPEIYVDTDSLKVPLAITNLNDQIVPGTIELKIDALKKPVRNYRSRFWTLPDQHILEKEEFQKQFPSYARDREDEPAHWDVVTTLPSITLKADTGKLALADLSPMRSQGSGTYRLRFSARTAAGDTVSAIRYVAFAAGDNESPIGLQNWVVVGKTSVTADENAVFYVGSGGNDQVQMEVYNGLTLVSREWFNTGGKMVKKLVKAKGRQLYVQFTTVIDNRAYQRRENIKISVPKSLEMHLSSSRSLLEPGNKEKWQVQIKGTDAEANMAEMLASMYDASLDAIVPAQQWWQNLMEGHTYNRDGYSWGTAQFVTSTQTSPARYRWDDYRTKDRMYDQIDMHGYEFYSDYNYGYVRYQRGINQNKKLAADLESLYRKNALLVKEGSDAKGVVVSADGNHLPGVIVTIKGTTIATSTDSEGNFKIKVPPKATLVFGYLGYLQQEVAASESRKVVLKEDQNSLNEVQIIGYGAQKKMSLSGAVSSITISGRGNLPADIIPGISVRNDTAEYSAGYYDRVGRESEGNAKSVPVRTNFNETAFFYPHLRTNEKGEIAFEFTVPDALTQWKFRAFSHTRDLRYGYLETTVITQKKLMVQANMPRFFREGDTIVISARVANVTAKKLNTNVELQLFNALNMRPLDLLAKGAGKMQFIELNGSSNGVVSFKLVIPSNLEAITYRISARAGTVSDAEESTVPVLPNSMLVTESLPFMVRPGKTGTFTLEKLKNNTSTTLTNKTLTLEFTQNPTWYAVQALPYLMEFPYECTEQTFSRYFANSMGAAIVNRQPRIKTLFEQWKSTTSTELLSNLERNQELKSMLLEETPWLRDAQNETEQKRRIALLFDLNKMDNDIGLNLQKLSGMQMPDGSFPWFHGSRYADRYITQHILAGMGQLIQLEMADLKKAEVKSIVGKGIGYLDNQLLTDWKYWMAKKLGPSTSSTYVHAWYTRSYFNTIPIPADLKPALKQYLNVASAQWRFLGPYEQAMLAITMLRNNKPDIAKLIVNSLSETAARSEELGMYWPKNQQGYYWYQSPVETQSLLIELFTLIGNKERDISEMKIWLLRNKQTTNWKTTKATTAACFALLLRGSDWLEDQVPSQINIGGKDLYQLKPDLKSNAGTGYLKTGWNDKQITDSLAKVDVTNRGAVINWGALHWQYTEKLDKITSHNNNIKLERKYFVSRETPSGIILKALTEQEQLKPGDLLNVVVYLSADREFEYVHLKDMRPAGTEPGNVISGYRYQDGLFYYQMMKDASANFFISHLPKGKYVFEYSLRVAQSGTFSTGISTIQCMYAPEFNAHSEGQKITIK